MKQFISKKIDKPFYIAETSDPVNGIPCFTKAEVEKIAALDPTAAELNHIFQKRSIAPISIEAALLDFFSEPKDSPHEEIGYTTNPTPQPAPTSLPEPPQSEWLTKIRQTIETTKIRSANEK